MIAVIPVLESEGTRKLSRSLSLDEIDGLNENARRVAKKYWELKGTGRSFESIQNQLDLARWFYLSEASYAREVICEVAGDLGANLHYFSC